MSRICILTPDPAYEENWQPVADRYAALLGLEVDFRCWHDAGDLGVGDLGGYALVLPLLAWGYHRAAARWFAALDAWEDAGVRFANPVATLRWNTNKDYLFDLEAAGVPTVPTRLTHALTRDDIEAARAAFGVETLIIKPSISGGADATFRLEPGDAIPFAVLETEMLIQPMMRSIETEGEYSLFYFGGQYSHAILKRPKSGDFRVQEQFGGGEVVCAPPSAARELADAALSAAPPGNSYARVDMLRGDAGGFVLIELELIEPSLFLEHASDGGAAFVNAVHAAY